MSLRARLRERLAIWARRRQGDDVLPLVLRANRIYILPTRAGIGFALLLFIMLLAGLNYTNSLALLITFVTAGYLVVGMYDCHRTLLGLRLVHAEAGDSFAGASGQLELRFDNDTAAARTMLQLCCAEGSPVRLHLPAATLQSHHAEFRLPRRGRHRLGRIALSTTAPLGLFRAWTWLHLLNDVVVYPQPGGGRPLPGGNGSRMRTQGNASGAGEDEWATLRPFHPGDSPRSVAWKLYARGAPLMVAQYQGAAGTERHLDYSQLDGIDTEQRLGQLAEWVLQCEQRNEAYSLSLPGLQLATGLGPAQQRAALRALALHGVAA